MKIAQSDEALMLDVRNGAGETLGVLFDRYQTPLFNFFLRLTGDRAGSEDLVQEAFYRILKYRQTYQPGTPFRAWLYQIARNARVDRFRKQRPEVDLDAAPVATVLPMDTAQEQQQNTLLRKALMQLPEEKREVLVLSRYQELKYEEIADLMDCEVNTVKVRVHRALKELGENYRRLESSHRAKRPGQQLGS
jgi:RNA polymerase sigma factor (sigma-70 family)